MFIIISRYEDAHALAVKWALERSGVECKILDFFEIVQDGWASLEDDLSSFRWWDPKEGREDSLRFKDVSCVWKRRTTRIFNMGSIHEDDAIPVQRELLSFVASVEALLSYHAGSNVNPARIKGAGDQKTVQLAAAAAAGLKAPRTIVSNEPSAIRSFYDGVSKCLMKPYNQNTWITNGQHFTQHAVTLDAADLSNDRALRNCPAIYQEYSEKSFELRVIVFGDIVRAIKLDSQSVETALVDWRDDYLGKMSVEEVPLPPKLVANILKMMRSLDLRFGCLDMICEPDGSYTFLEINEQGQFLWLEEKNPSLDLLKSFIEFMSAEAGIDHEIADVSLSRYYADSTYRIDTDYVQLRSEIRCNDKNRQPAL
ncbi:hypothetical protein SAMN05428989_4106 [Pseudoxanthomonas sp. GM95]|uniref:hypothetical protein n=1 Tax=Pseudoxanthomonas sp. GM95 TaxID=1881043 RepID=UPI0008B36129|nr:hypothetical protein [Pseudoxanthomonas sp. GM95]SEM58099.1 hypothetical protein SAMN05428989_4106 [Pseudoxanthomonas sp. GM95]